MHTAGSGAETGPFLDFERTLKQGTPEPLLPVASRQRGPSLGLALSLALHLLPLLLLLEWSAAPVEVPETIPVQLVLEQPPPAPPPPPPPEPVARPPIAKPPPPPPQGRLASEEMGARGDDAAPTEVSSPTQAPPADAPPSETPPSETPPRAEAAETEPPREAATRSKPEIQPAPELRQVANLISPEREPTLLAREALALPVPVVEPLPERPAAPPAPAASRQPAPRPQPPQRAAAVEGPPAIRDAYLAHLVTLVRPHLRLLPPEIINGRQGTTSLAIRVLGDGTIARISVSRSSGYPDIDARVVQIVSAVGRFPPLPPWIDQPSWDINFHLRFPFPQGGSGR